MSQALSPATQRPGARRSPRVSERTQVAIVGAGPAGLLLGALLHRAGVHGTILECRDRGYVEQRVRAGMLEHGTVELLRELGAAARLEAEGFEHASFEVRIDGRRRHVPMSELTGGRTTWMYGQQEVVKDLIALRLEQGEPLVFEAEDVTLEDVDGARPTVTYRHHGRRHELACDLIAGCDGFHGVSRRALPAGVLRTFERDYPFAWLGILAHAPPATTEELIYAHHEHGFALHSFRTPELARLYLQVRPDERVEDWSDERIWDELRIRFDTDDGDWALPHGPLSQKSITPMRSFVAEPMRWGRLCLAGDAAHIVPPTAAKGLNLAAADVSLLADLLVDCLVHGRWRALEHYSDAALRRVWRIEQFSDEMTAMLHSEGTNPIGVRLQRAALERLCDSRSYAAAFCDTYVGMPFSAARQDSYDDGSQPCPRRFTSPRAASLGSTR